MVFFFNLDIYFSAKKNYIKTTPMSFYVPPSQPNQLSKNIIFYDKLPLVHQHDKTQSLVLSDLSQNKQLKPQPIKQLRSNHSEHYKSKTEQHYLKVAIKLQKSHQKNKSKDHIQKLNRGSYECLNRQRYQKQRSIKYSNYLLPKLCEKSKKSYKLSTLQNFAQQKIFQQNKSNFESNKPNLLKQKQFPKNQRKHKQKPKLSQELTLNQQVQQETQKFKNKCQLAIEKLQLKFPLMSHQKKCFFDLSQDDTQQIALIQYSPLQDNNSQEKHKQKKDKLVQKKFESLELDIQNQNSSVPSFLMERLSLKDSYLKKATSFRLKKTISRLNLQYKYKTKLKSENKFSKASFSMLNQFIDLK